MKNNSLLNDILSKCKENKGCLEWTGYISKKKTNPLWKYPQIYALNKTWRGNRLVLFLSTGNIPEGMSALHKCDNSICLNPDHLYWGTQKQNVKDSHDRKRAKNAKVTHCPVGHKYAGKNLRMYKGERYCRSCNWYKNRNLKPNKEIPEKFRDKLSSITAETLDERDAFYVSIVKNTKEQGE